MNDENVTLPNLNTSEACWPILIKFMYSITRGGERLHNVLRQIGSKLTYNEENGVPTFFRSLLIQSFLYLQVTRTCIKSRTSSNFGQIGPLTMELAALERLKDFP